MLSIIVTKVVTPHDMRSIHKCRAAVRCRVGEGWLFINQAATIARLVDSTHNIHTYYAPRKRKFDLPTLQTAVAGLRLRLILPAEATSGEGAPIAQRGRRAARAKLVQASA